MESLRLWLLHSISTLAFSSLNFLLWYLTPMVLLFLHAKGARHGEIVLKIVSSLSYAPFHLTCKQFMLVPAFFFLGSLLYVCNVHVSFYVCAILIVPYVSKWYINNSSGTSSKSVLLTHVWGNGFLLLRVRYGWHKSGSSIIL